MNEETSSLEERKHKYQDNRLLSVLTEQDFSKIVKLKTKFTDDLFPPDNTSIFSGKNPLSKPLPKFIRVSSF